MFELKVRGSGPVYCFDMVDVSERVRIKSITKFSVRVSGRIDFCVAYIVLHFVGALSTIWLILHGVFHCVWRLS